MAANYRKQVAWSDEDQAWVASAPDFPGLSAIGDSDVTALAELNTVIDEALDIYDTEGWPLPASKPLQADFSGQLRLRLPRSVHAQAVHRAEHEGVSLNALLQTFISYGLGSFEALSETQKRIEAIAGQVRTEIMLHELWKQPNEEPGLVGDYKRIPADVIKRHYLLPPGPRIMPGTAVDVADFPTGTEVSKPLGRLESLSMLPKEAIQ